MELNTEIDKALNYEIKPKIINGNLSPSMGQRGTWNYIIVPAAKNTEQSQALLDVLNSIIFAFESNKQINEAINDAKKFLNI